MGILSTGILGPFRKKTGAVIGRKHRGQDVMTGLHRKSGKGKEGTPKQQVSRIKFALLNVFLNNIVDLVNPGFKKLAKTGNPVNKAYSYNYGHAFIVDGEDVKLDFPKLVYSRGNVEGPESLQMVSENGNITMNWLQQPQSLYCQHTDKASFLFYAEETGASVCIPNYCERSALTVTIDVHPFIGQDLHCYISFASADGKRQGNSLYLGVLTVVV